MEAKGAGGALRSQQLACQILKIQCPRTFPIPSHCREYFREEFAQILPSRCRSTRSLERTSESCFFARKFSNLDVPACQLLLRKVIIERTLEIDFVGACHGALCEPLRAGVLFRSHLFEAHQQIAHNDFAGFKYMYIVRNTFCKRTHSVA